MNFTKKDLINWTLELTNAYENYPFKRKGRDHTAIRHHRNHKILAIIFEQDGKLLISLKLKPDQVEEALSSQGIVKGIGLNKKHWITISVNETELSQDELEQMIFQSSRLTMV